MNGSVSHQSFRREHILEFQSLSAAADIRTILRRTEGCIEKSGVACDKSLIRELLAAVDADEGGAELGSRMRISFSEGVFSDMDCKSIQCAGSGFTASIPQ